MSDDQTGPLLSLLDRIASALERVAFRIESAPPIQPVEFGLVEGDEKSPYAEIPNSLSTDQADDRPPFDGEVQLQDFLRGRGISIKAKLAANESDPILDQIATFLGTRFVSVSKLYDAIKRNLNYGTNFSVQLREDTQVDVSNICHLGKTLHQIAFLTSYRYFKSPQYTIHAQPSRLPKAINFLTGGWLERYVRSQAISSITRFRPGKRVASLGNIQVVMPNGDDFELDLLVLVEGGEVFWFEAKTGEYQQSVQKYMKISRILRLDPHHSLMVLTEITRTTASDVSGLFNMTVAAIEDFEPVLNDILIKTCDKVFEDK